MTIKLNVGFVRWTKKPGKRGQRIEQKNKVGVVLKGLDWDGPHGIIREELMKLKPEGDGWSTHGYHLTAEGVGV